MKKKFKVEGIDCPNCAAKIEEMVGKLEGITSSKINFMAEKLTVEVEESALEGLLENIKKTVNIVEPDAVVAEI